MGRKRKVTFYGGTYYVGSKIPPSKCPKKCVRDGKSCAFRMKITGMSGMWGASTMCGYIYFTGRMRNSYEPDACDKWAEHLPTEILMTIWDEEERKTDGGIYDE